MSPLHVELQLDYLLLHSFTRILLTVGFIAGDLFQKIYISVKYWRYIGGVLFTFYTFTVSHIPVYLWYKSKYRLPFFRVKIRLWKLNVLKIRDKKYEYFKLNTSMIHWKPSCCLLQSFFIFNISGYINKPNSIR